MRKLPVFKTIKEVLSGVTLHFFQLAWAAWPALLVTTAAMVWYLKIVFSQMAVFAAIDHAQKQKDTEAVRAHFAELLTAGRVAEVGVCFILLMIGFAVAAVRWHRFVLIGEGAGNQSGSVKPWRHEDGVYIWTTIKVLFLISIMMFGIWFIMSTAGWLLAKVGLLVIGEEGQVYSGGWIIGLGLLATLSAYITTMQRLMLALPDAAIGRGGRVFTIFRETRGNGWRLFGAYFILFFAIMLGFAVFGLVSSIITSQLNVSDLSSDALGTNYPLMIGLGLMNAVLYLFFVMLQVTMLSVAYREIIGLPGEAAPELAADDLRIEPV